MFKANFKSENILMHSAFLYIIKMYISQGQRKAWLKRIIMCLGFSGFYVDSRKLTKLFDMLKLILLAERAHGSDHGPVAPN